MHPLDWSIVAALLLVLLVAAVRTRRHTKSVTAFLAANRCGGRYVISVANGIAALGVITLVGYFEQNYKVGYTSIWWGTMTEPALIVLALSGWVIYRFRQTRAMTLAQFFELRYSRRFRVFAGLVAYASGIINFGIFPAVGARFFIALCGLSDAYEIAGTTVPTFPALMLLLLAVALLFTFLGGLIAVMVTDFLQGVFANVVFAVLIVYLLIAFPWSAITDTLLAAPVGASLVNPADLGDEEHFNVWFYVISVVVVFYSVLGWQGTQGYNCCAKDAHEAKMAGILNGWRFRVLMLVVIVVPIAVRTFLEHPQWAEAAAPVRAALDGFDSDALRNQARTPLALAAILPTGLLGLVAAAMLAAFVTTHDTYLHSWGAILVQDVILPFRKRPLSARQHLFLLRLSIFVVAVFIYMFSLLFEQTQYIWMFLALTGAVFVGGAGATIIGGLYWKHGTTAGAWAAMLTGMALSGGGILVKQVDAAFLATNPAPRFLWTIVEWLQDYNGQQMTFFAIVGAILAYVVVSLLGPGAAFDMDRLLHRGDHAVAGEHAVEPHEARTWLEKLGLDREFTGADRIITYVSIGWPLVWTLLFAVGTGWGLAADPRWGLVAPISSETWLAFWHGWTWTILAASIAVTVWFAIGGAGDLRYLFRHLASAENPHEDGRVEDHHIVGEEDSP